ncbi:ImmA/IrrE family metallo-endopeptidase [Neobacillus drentensis]|uniref:ImmA/IrrE family metallo-endopeptidase n=1 Tax=Neobacillus drentensis TaxID=220684 RepID=UPI002FFDADD2
MNYIYNPLEDQVKKLYQHLSTIVPEEIDMIDIAAKLDIWLHFEDLSSKAIEHSGVYSMFIDRRLSPQQQWQDFGHELCHALMHSGNQLNLPLEFVMYQESKARNFALHFCIPTFMLERLDLPPIKKEAIEVISKTFNVELNFAKVRLEQWLQQQDSFLFFEKIVEATPLYELEQSSNEVIYLGSDVDDLPAPPEMIEDS